MKIKSYKNNVTEENKQIKRLIDEILEVIQDEKFDNKIHDSVSRIETCLALPSATNSTNSNASYLDGVSSNPKHSHHFDAKLPKVDKLKFNGKPIEWQSFGNRFSTAVDSKTNIPDVVKFSLLKGVLWKDVQESICGLLVTNENYSTALNHFTITLWKLSNFNKFLWKVLYI